MHKIAILGHKGMLGNAVHAYFVTQGYDVGVVAARWPTPEFWQELEARVPDVVINCIGAIPQKTPTSFIGPNYVLPVELADRDYRLIQPATDCEFSGKALKPYSKISAMDATACYGQSKAEFTNFAVQNKLDGVKLIRTSIIGHELGTKYALLEWFLATTGAIDGYANYYWNGITSFEWCNQCHRIVDDFEAAPPLTQVGSEYTTKWQLLSYIKEIYGVPVEIRKKFLPEPVNRCLVSDFKVDPIECQLVRLKYFYGK